MKLKVVNDLGISQEISVPFRSYLDLKGQHRLEESDRVIVQLRDPWDGKPSDFTRIYTPAYDRMHDGRPSWDLARNDEKFLVESGLSLMTYYELDFTAPRILSSVTSGELDE